MANAERVHGDVESLLSTIMNVLGEIDRRREHNLREMQEACVELSVAIAARLAWTEIDRRGLGVDKLVAAVIERMRGRQPLVLYLHPLDLELWQRQTAGNRRGWEDAVRIEGDSRVPRGDCRAVCDEFHLVRDIELEIREIHERLLQGIEDVAVERRKDVHARQGLRRFPDRRADT
jgi:hypothetical protein